jgi:hypothetical protein
MKPSHSESTNANVTRKDLKMRNFGKKLSFAILILTILLAACAAAGQPTTNANASDAKPTESVPVLEAKNYIDGQSGTHLYGVYEYTKSTGQICVIVVDVYVASVGDSNSSPTISCP